MSSVPEPREPAPRATAVGNDSGIGFSPAAGDRPIRVLIVDDHDFFRSGLRALLSGLAGIEVVGEAADGVVALDLYGRRRPDVVLMDLRMPRLSGSEATERLRRRWPDARVLMLSASAEDTDVVDAVRMGALGYVVKEASIEEIVQGIRAAASGHFLTSPRVAGAVVDAAGTAASRSQQQSQIRTRLTARELEILKLLADGKANAEIGGELHLSPSTIKHYVAEILTKLGAENRVEAAVLAVRSGVV